MSNSVKRILALLLCIVLLLQVAACGNKNDKKATVKISGATVWSAPSTIKIARENVDYADKGAAELHYNVVRNEYESQQLIITATKDVEAYDLEICDLKNGDNVISKDNIEVYNEKYVYVADSGYEPASMPDALLPLDVAREYGELKIEKNQNGALWICIYVPKEIPAGVYEGTFKLTVGKGTADIPVTVTVNDYTLTDEVTAKTLFSWRYDRVGAGELDSSIEMMEKYYEFFVDHRISLQTMPLESLTGEEFATCLKKYYDRISTYCFLSEVGNTSGSLYSKEEEFREQIYAVAEMSSPEKNYFEKGMIYTIDEPDVENAEMKRAHLITYYQTVKDYLVKFADEIAKDQSGRFDAFKQIKNWREYIIDIPNVVPTSSDWVLKNPESERAQMYFDLINCYCPHWHHIEGNRIPLVEDLREKYDMDIWWYGSMWPLAPGANYHINNKNLLSSRSITWIQKKLGIDGNLYWDAAAYTTENADHFNQYIDVFDYPWRIDGVPAGDGFLTYPGEAYGIDGPITTVRMMSIRDGNEEYEILSDVENRYKEMAKANGNAFGVDEVMEQFYTSLYDGAASMYIDGENGLDFDSVRASLIDTAVLFAKDVSFAMQLGSIEDNIATVSYYLTGDCKVFIDDKQQKPVSGNKYEYKIDLEETTSLTFVFETSDGTKYEVNRFVANPIYLLQDLSNASVLKEITMPKGSSAKLVETDEFSTDGTSVLMNVNGVITGDDVEDSVYTPKVTLSTKMLKNVEKLSELSKIEMDIYNPGEAFKFKVCIYSGTAYAQMGSFEILPGKNTITLDIANAGFSMMDQADKIALEFVNTEDGETANTYNFYIDNIVKKQ